MRKSGWFIPLNAAVFFGVIVTVSACQKSAPSADAAPAPAQPTYAPTATIKDLMLSIVDPSADIVWLSVTTVQSSAGTVDTAPKNDEEWQKVRHGAIALAEATNLLIMPGRHVAKPGEKSETPGVELRTVGDGSAHRQGPRGVGDASQGASRAALNIVKAVDAKDSQKVFEVGEEIEVALRKLPPAVLVSE